MPKTYGQNSLWVDFGYNFTTNSDNYPMAMTTDLKGNVIETGIIDSTVSFGTYTVHASSSLTGGFGVYLVKYNSTGTVLWALSSTPNGSLVTSVSLVSDTDGNIYLAGYFSGILSLGGASLVSNIYGSSVASDAFFIAKFDPNGNILWLHGASKYKGDCYSCSLTIDRANNVYLEGMFQDTLNIDNHTVICPSGFMKIGMFIAKYTPLGNVLWVNETILTGGGGTANSDYPSLNEIASDTSANIYALGIFADTLSSGSVNMIGRGGGTVYSYNYFLLKFDSSGNAQWAKQPTILSSTTEIEMTQGDGLAIATDPASNIYITGNYGGKISFGAYMLPATNISSAGTAFLAKYNPAGNVIWAEEMVPPGNSNSSSNGSSLSADKWGHLYMGGYCNPSDSIAGIYLSGSGSFLLKLDTNGHGICGTIVGGDYYGLNGVIASPILPNVYLGGTVVLSIFGKDTNNNGGLVGYAAEWTCSKCQLIPQIVGKSSICQGQSTTLIAGGGTSYVWNNGETTDSIQITPTSSGFYSVSVTKDSCTLNDSVHVSVYPYPVPTITNEQFICPGQIDTIFASGGSIYTWSNGLSASYISVSPSSTTIYTVNISNGKCVVKDSSIIVVNPLPVINACCDSTIIVGGNVQLYTTGGATYQWTPSISLSCSDCPNPIASPTTTTIYTISVISDSGCSSLKTVTIDVFCGNLFIPEAFSPNGDGQNDKLYVRDDCIRAMDFMIFDRWGNKVFETTDQSIPWDGRYKGEAMNAGSYAYYLAATMYDGSTVQKKGEVTLVR